jgi:subtilisin family serine protease
MLDRLYSKYKKSNTELANQAYFISDCIKYNLSEKWIYDYKKEVDNKIKKTYNLNYYDRKNIDSKPDDISFINYGNPYISKNMDEFYHGTLIAGLIGANRGNAIGINGITNNVKIMPLAISSNGEEHDKDIALAIRYAVDNGAEIINMSFGKNFSLYKEWVFEAIKYAEKSNVLIVSSAGNSSYNLNEYNNYYPNDNIENQEEVANNFLLVGSISNKLDNSFLSYYSNYGNIDVDIFAPGETIYTTLPSNKYKYDNGTSLASAITSGVAALIFSYYPNLTASQVKHILMDSGLEYTIEVNTPTKEDKNKTTPFNQLSKSGKVLNAYNALLMAAEISKN